MSRPTDAQIAAKIREEFPKHSRAAYSLARNTQATGVMLCPRAREIRAEYLKQTRKKENRKFAFRVYGRIPDELAVRVLTKLQGGSVQDLLLMLLTEWVMKEDGKEETECSNAHKLRTMSDEELAEWLEPRTFQYGWLEWLKSPVDKGE